MFYYSLNLNKVYKIIYFIFQNNINNLIKAKFDMKKIFFDLMGGGVQKLIFLLKMKKKIQILLFSPPKKNFGP